MSWWDSGTESEHERKPGALSIVWPITLVLKWWQMYHTNMLVIGEPGYGDKWELSTVFQFSYKSRLYKY